MWNELYWQTVSPLFVALSEIFLSAEEFSRLSVSTTLKSLHLVYFEELVVRGDDSWTVEEWNKTVRGQNIVFETSCPFNNWPSNHISHLLFNFLQRKTYCLSFLMASTSWKTLTQACHENLWLGFLVVVSLLFEDGLQVYDVKTITLPMPWRWCCLAWPLGNREHKQVNTSKWTQVNTSSMASWKAWTQADAASESESTCFPSSATNPNSEQSILRSSCSSPSSHGTSNIALKEPKQSRQTQGSPTGLQHDANVASRHDRSARLMVLDHWSIPLYPCTPLCYICWSVPLYPTIADLHLTAHVE